jgi:hypothetical protein
MPALPTINVTDAQMSRLLAVFGDGVKYRAWLVQQLKNAVIAHEMRALDERQRAEREAKRAEVAADLDTAT